MIIDLILDRMDGKPYCAKEFYNQVTEYDLMFCCLGNGTSVCNRAKEEYGDYQNIAHGISLSASIMRKIIYLISAGYVNIAHYQTAPAS